MNNNNLFLKNVIFDCRHDYSIMTGPKDKTGCDPSNCNLRPWMLLSQILSVSEQLHT